MNHAACIEGLPAQVQELFQNALGSLGGGGSLDISGVTGKALSDFPARLITGIGDIFTNEFGADGRKAAGHRGTLREHRKRAD